MPYPYINAQGEIEADETWWATMQSTGEVRNERPSAGCHRSVPCRRRASLAAKLAKIGLHTIQDLLLHLPCVMKIVPKYAINDLLRAFGQLLKAMSCIPRLLWAPAA